jgi:hydroxyacylglutathione hydrolase
MVLLNVTAIPAFEDNYLWLITDAESNACIVDPGDAEPVLAVLQKQHLKLTTILVTHHHNDHIGGIEKLVAATGAIVYGPAKETIPHITHKLENTNKINILNELCEVIYTPGHTQGHIAYYFPQQAKLFCGDTLFVAGCGRLFEGSPAQMFASLSNLAMLPPSTQIYCAHEYTLSNLRFAQAVEPSNHDIEDKIKRCQELRKMGIPTVPSTIEEELATNPFLRSHKPTVLKAAKEHTGKSDMTDVEVFASIRAWKDGFR